MRIISLLLVAAMMLCWIPAATPVSAVSDQAERETVADTIIQQIRNAYKQSLRASGKSSFHGYCGAMVSWQTYCLGIDKQVYYCNGNDQYDMYNDMEKTTGGYSIDAYSAKNYTLQQALKTITNNGTRDAFNLIVCFQKTSTQAGQIYGHALFVHAILDGMVYYSESYNATVNGTYYAEGAPIICTIEQFAAYYDRWTVFEGVINFGLKTYADVCDMYPCAMKAMAIADGFIYEEPADPGVYEAEAVKELVTGQWLTVTRLLKTPNGKYWYEVNVDGYARYVEAEYLVMGSLDQSGIGVSNVKAPTYLHKGYGYSMSGTVSSQDLNIRTVRVSVYSVEDYSSPMFSAAMDVNSKSASLSKSQLNNALTFRKLPAGTYELRLTIDVEVYVVDGGRMVEKRVPVNLWNSHFLVVEDWNTYYTVKFDGNGGKSALNQLVLAKNGTIANLPTAERSGYSFVGWTLDKAGTVPVTAETTFSKTTTLYAQWTPGHSGQGGWQETAEGWHYCAGDHPVEGWIRFGDLQFYQYSDGTFATGWVWIDQTMRYFNEAGVLITHLDGMNGEGFDVNTDGLWGWQASGSAPSGPIQLTTEEAVQRMNEIENMPAAGRALQKLSSSLYYLAVKLTSGELPQQIQEAMDQQ